MGMSMFSEPSRLAADDRLEDFRCGMQVVDDWVARHARMAERQGTAVVYVSRDGQGRVAGLYSLSAHSVDRAKVAGGWLRRNVPDRIPAILLGMLGVDVHFQRQGLGRMLLHDAVVRSMSIAGQVGARALVVDPADDAAARFYERNGFRPIPGSERMFFKLA